jgi:antitoxin component YwqK of YwqJK toxin-antitoxin module
VIHKPHILILAAFLLCSGQGFAQKMKFELYKGDTVNRVDSSGRWRGHCVFFFYNQDLPMNLRDSTIQEGDYVNGKREGEWRTFYPDGKLKESVFYKDGFVDGKVKLYFPTGCPALEGNYFRGYWSGEFVQYYSDSCGKILCRRDLGENGKEIRNEYSPGSIWDNKVEEYACTQPVCCACDSLRTDSSLQLFSNSKIQNEIIVMKNGWIKTYFFPASNGVIWDTRNNDLDTLATFGIDSVYTQYFFFEKTRNKASIREGAIYRKEKVVAYYPNGSIHTITNGRIHHYNWQMYVCGPYFEYYPNGNRKTAGCYKIRSWAKNPLYGHMNMTPKRWPDSKPKGKWITWYEDGKVSGKCIFVCGIPVSRKYFDEQGKRTKTPPDQLTPHYRSRF